MCSSPDDYHITVPPSYENLDDEIYQPFPAPLSPTCAHLSETSNKSGEQEQKIGGLLLSQMEEEPVMQMDMPHTALNVDRPVKQCIILVSEKGIPALWNVLNNTSFKGQGHEEEDLQILMSEIEQWGQQLYPEEPFETFINQLEDVSDHPSIQTCVQSLRRGIVTPCAMSGSGGCEDKCCTMGNVVKPQKSTKDEDHPET
ncbi:TIMELESS-interacting protein isoform X1 [Astyanax mexicanus]|uniref:TIMELESS-interacting protein isoform X1 n=1 Tax=Astyanax mexicanus TaxID=7994 RepID=UPI0020CB60B7|nr:TIMELESS-interacting protein isoform X1 [Astyanax mexicanus]